MIALAVTRVCQAVFCAVVLGLTVSLIKHQQYGSAPALTSFSAFAGGFGILAGLIGGAALFFEPLAGIVGAAVDGLASLFLLAGGIAVAVNLRGINCSSNSDLQILKMVLNSQLNGGCVKANTKNNIVCGVDLDADTTGQARGLLRERCKKDQAADVFMFFGFVVSAAALVLGFLAMRRSRATGSGSFGINLGNRK